MKTTVSQFILLEKFHLWLKNNFSKYKCAFFSSLIFGILTYTFAFANKLINHDEVISLFAKGSGLSSGRWALDLMHYIFPNYSMPWIYGIVSLLLMAVSVCIIVHIFEIKNTILQILLAGSIVAFPSLIGTFSYMFTASSYVFAFFLSVVSSYFFVKESWLSKIVAVVFLVFSLGIYQSYISVAAGLLLVFMLKKLLYSEEKIGKIIKEGILYVVGLGISLGGYYAITQLLLYITNSGFNSYVNTNNFSIASIIENIFKAYYGFFGIIFDQRFCIITTAASKFVHLVLIALACVIMLFAWIKIDIPKKLLTAVVVCLLPLSITCMFIFAGESSIHTLVLYGFIALYVMFVLVFDNVDIDEHCANKVKALAFRVAKEVMAWGMVIIVMSNVYIGNAVYLRMYVCYENMYGFYSSVITQVKSTPGFDESSKIAFVGDAGESVFVNPKFYEEGTEITGTLGVNVNTYTRIDFIINYIGVDLTFANSQEVEEIKQTPEYAEMPIYPYYGSVAKIGDYVVVKFQ